MVIKHENVCFTENLQYEEKAHAPSPSTPRVKKAIERVLKTKPSIDLERAKIVTETFMKTEGEPWVLRRAKAFKEQCSKQPVFIQEGELIVGNPGSVPRAGVLCPDVSYRYLDEELDTISSREQDPFKVTEEQKKLFREFIKPYWKGKNLDDAWMARVPDDIQKLIVRTSILDVEAKAQNGPGEQSAGIEFFITNGLQGIREKIRCKLNTLTLSVPGDYEKITYLNSLLIVSEGIEILANRYATLAEEQANEEKNPQRKAELEKIAKICHWVPLNPARNFWEAVQASWFCQASLHMELKGTAYSPGHMDRYLYPYYKKDIAEGIHNQGEIQELIECLWVKFAEVSSLYSKWTATYYSGYMPFQNVVVGGTTENGIDAVNELSYMMIQATMDVRLNQPSLSVKYHRGKNPDSFLRKVADLVSLGTGFPAIFIDKVGMMMLLDKGVPLEEAHDWVVIGCVEPTLSGKMYQWVHLGYLNLASAIELVLLNGKSRMVKERLPVPDTGDPRYLKTFEDFENAVKTQLAYLIKKMAEAGQILEKTSRELRPCLVTSLTFESCIENATDYQCGGAKYNSGHSIDFTGISDIVNCLAAVKKLIYDNKSLTWDELLNALDKNFEGCEEIRQMCLDAPKFGNDNDEVDCIATEFYKFAGLEVRKYKSMTGSKLMTGLFPVTAHISMGKAIGALPSGRKAWTPLADGVSPMQGTDTTGPTAIIKSVSKINHALHTNGTLLNMRLDPSIFNEERGIRNFMSLIKSASDLDIYHIQFNVVKTKTLLAAQKDPEKYRNLLVRVAGYTAYFVELAKPVQDEIISRSIHAL